MLRIEFQAEFICVQYVCPESLPRNIGVLLLDRQSNTLHSRFTENWSGFDESALDLISQLSEHIYTRGPELGAELLIEFLDVTLVGPLCLSHVGSIMVQDVELELGRLGKEFLSFEALAIASGNCREVSAIKYSSYSEHTSLASVNPTPVTRQRTLRSFAGFRAGMLGAAAAAACVLMLIVMIKDVSKRNTVKIHNSSHIQLLATAPKQIGRLNLVMSSPIDVPLNLKLSTRVHTARRYKQVGSSVCAECRCKSHVRSVPI